MYLSIWHYFFGFLQIHLDSKAWDTSANFHPCQIRRAFRRIRLKRKLYYLALRYKYIYLSDHCESNNRFILVIWNEHSLLLNSHSKHRCFFRQLPNSVKQCWNEKKRSSSKLVSRIRFKRKQLFLRWDLFLLSFDSIIFSEIDVREWRNEIENVACCLKLVYDSLFTHVRTSFPENFTEEITRWVRARNCVLNFKPLGNAYRWERSFYQSQRSLALGILSTKKNRGIVVLMLARLVSVFIASRRYLKNW